MVVKGQGSVKSKENVGDNDLILSPIRRVRSLSFKEIEAQIKKGNPLKF